MTRLWFFVLVFIWPVISDAQRLWSHQKPLRKNAALFDSNESQAELLRERLPRVVNVSRYELIIFPHFPFLGLYQEKPDFTFDGTVRIHFTIAQTTQNIWLFAQNLLEFSSVQLSTEDGSIPINFFATNPNTTRLTLKTVEPLSVGQKCTLKIDYKGPINEYGDAGLYFSKYMDDGGDFQYLVGTFFEPMRARKMYPSFDDPYFKATFQLSVVYPKLAKVYSNVAEGKNHEYNKNYNMMEFGESTRMSSYLLAFVIGNFKSALAKTKRGVPVQTIAIPELADYLPASAQIGANCIDGMEKLVNVDYPLNKLDNVEMIEMGHSSAMENFGLIVYTRVEQTTIMCHEISHQWFGDLVTADRWGYEFLHESFAAFFQKSERHNNSEQIKKTLLKALWSGTKMPACTVKKKLNMLWLRIEHTSTMLPTTPGRGAILRMFERVLGSDNFFKALNRYLTKHQFSNAKADDLIDEFVAVIDKPLCGKMDARKIFDGFLKNSHYPGC
ncbi:hypothetical protein M3Y97_00008500 [Aphelenchoides bicaudatus]|nr:hypothetical protein M3Y97_00008500 [Aphelenchoides bicaudatus]